MAKKKLPLVLTLTNYLLLGLVLFTQGISKVSLSFPNPRLNKKEKRKVIGRGIFTFGLDKKKRVKVKVAFYLMP